MVYDEFEALITSTEEVDNLKVSNMADDLLGRMNEITGRYVELAQSL